MLEFQSFQSFSAIIPPQPELLILGSMPSTRSIAQKQYYAHPQNTFWPILAAVYTETNLLCETNLPQWQKGSHHKLPYTTKVKLLQQAHIALWDVLASCKRQNSSDASIRHVACNPIANLLTEQPSLRKVLLNGQKAASLFQHYVQPLLLPSAEKNNPRAKSNLTFQLLVLPSSSPANATLTFTQKLELWRPALLNA